jgi:hypothetical protein
LLLSIQEAIEPVQSQRRQSSKILEASFVWDDYLASLDDLAVAFGATGSFFAFAVSALGLETALAGTAFSVALVGFLIDVFTVFGAVFSEVDLVIFVI